MHLSLLVRETGTNIPTLRHLGEVSVNCHVAYNAGARSTPRLHGRKHRRQGQTPQRWACQPETKSSLMTWHRHRLERHTTVQEDTVL